LPIEHAQSVPTLRAQPKVDPVLVTKADAAALCSVDPATIEELIREGKLSIAVVKGEVLIPYRALLELAGVARWRYQEIC
jgi:hypothetical protein